MFLPKKALCLSVLFFYTFLLLPTGLHAQESVGKATKRLSIPVSGNVTLVKEENVSNLLVNNYLSSNVLEVNADGEVDIQIYSPFGSITGGSIANDHQFTNHRKLDNLTVYHAGARFYSLSFGQFIQPDQKEGPNRYAYARNNPIAFIDPDGNSATSAVLKKLREEIAGWLSGRTLSDFRLPPIDEGIARVYHGAAPSIQGINDIIDNGLDVKLSQPMVETFGHRPFATFSDNLEKPAGYAASNHDSPGGLVLELPLRSNAVLFSAGDFRDPRRAYDVPPRDLTPEEYDDPANWERLYGFREGSPLLKNVRDLGSHNAGADYYLAGKRGVIAPETITGAFFASRARSTAPTYLSRTYIRIPGVGDMLKANIQKLHDVGMIVDGEVRRMR